MSDLYQWVAVHADGTATHEFDEARPDGRGWHERVAQPVTAILLLDGDVPHYSVAVPSQAEPVFFRRRQIAIQNGAEQGRTTIHCIGWKQGEQECYLFIFEDGRTLLTHDLQAV